MQNIFAGMEESTTKPAGIRRNRQDICRLLKQFEKAGGGVKEFCDTHNIGRSTFRKWQTRYKSKRQPQPASKGFAQIDIIAAGHSAVLFAEVNGIKIYQPVSAVYLKALMR